MKIKVLFVCKGNVFRSYSAESLLKDYLKKNDIKNWIVFSAGTVAKKENVHPEVIKKLGSLGVEVGLHKQHKLNKPLLKKYDVVIAMADEQTNFMKEKFNFTNSYLFNEIAINKKIPILDVDQEVKNYLTDKRAVNKKIKETIQYIYKNIPNLVDGIINIYKK